MDSMAQRIQIALQTLKRNVDAERTKDISTDITKPQMFMLHAISRHKRSMLTHLAEELEVKPSAITVMIDRVEKAGYVKRTHDTADRRIIWVELTQEGQEILDKAFQQWNEVLNSYLARLSPEEVATMTVLLEKLVGHER